MIATSYYPHSPLLANCCYHICHGGHGTVLKAMAAGIPMIIVPLGRDQPGVARRAKQLGSAIIISDKTCNRRTLVAAITELETNSQYARNAEAYAAKLRNSHVSADGYLRLRTFIASVIQSQK